jgi:hypothetical protein
MKPLRIIPSFCLAASLALTSCATKFTQDQRNALSTVTVAGTTVDPDAYEAPYGGDVQMRKNSSNVPATGILGPLIGMGIGSAVAGTQNANFKGKNSGYFAAVQKNTPADLGKTLGGKLKQQLKNDSFFRNRVTDGSSNLVTSEITTYRLVRTGKNADGTLTFAPEVYADIHLKDSKGKNLVGRTYIGTGYGARPVTDYATSAATTKQAYDTALNNAVAEFMTELRAKTGE